MLERLCTKRMFALLLAGFAILISLPAHAESCGVRDVMIERLKNTYQEELAGGGIHDGKAVVEVWASEVTGSFTVLSTDANGRSCIMATGTNWHGHSARRASASFES